MLKKIDLSRIKVRLDNINKKATRSVSFEPSDVAVKMPDYYKSPVLECLEEFNSSHLLDPKENGLMNEWNIYGYDESVQDFRALEGDLLFCSSSVIKLEDRYAFSLTVLPYFITSMRKFKSIRDDDIRFAINPTKIRNRIIIDAKTTAILETVEPHSIVLIDGPLVGKQATSKLVKMDNSLRERDCIPIYFVKNSDSRLVIDNTRGLSNHYNSDFHWAANKLETNHRSAFFRYTDQRSRNHSKVFAYLKVLSGFPERVEMHSMTYQKYGHLILRLMNLIAYLYLVQGDNANPQVRPVAIAEKYAREGLKMLNIPVLLGRLGFRPTVNQARFG